MSVPKRTEIGRGPYTVHKFSPHLYPFEIRLGVFRIFHSLSWSIWLIHVAYGLVLTILIQRDRSCSTWSLRTAMLAEFFLTCPEALVAMNIALGLFSGRADKPRPRYELYGEVAPAVDVMITCCGEPIPTVVNTVKAALAQNYPWQSLRVFVLDDGQGAVLQTALETLVLGLRRTSSPTLRYLSHAKDRTTKSYFKSGNRRFGIDASQQMGGGSEYLAGLDADMIVDPDWLRKMVPHLILNDRVACVCGPQVRYSATSDPALGYQNTKSWQGDKADAFAFQNYYHLPISDPLGQQAEFDVGYTVQGVLNDCISAPMCTGTGYVTKRNALNQIGGWPLAYTGEDYMCSALLTGAGWEVVFTREPLQVGLAPESIKGLTAQRMRWVSAKSFAASLMPTVAAFAAVASYLAFSVVLTSITFHFALYQRDADLTEYRHSSKEIMKYTSGSHRICRARA